MKPAIFIIDKNPGILSAFRNILEGKNFLVFTETSGDNSLREILKFKPNVVIIDLKVPATEQLDLIQQIKTKHPNAIIIVMTSCWNCLTEQDAIRFGADDYLKKPFDVEAMLAKIEKHLAPVPELQRQMQESPIPARNMVQNIC